MAGGIYEQLDWPDSRSDYVQVCDGCHTAIWSTRWNEETSDGYRPRTDGGEPAADRRLTKTEHLAAPAQTQTPRNGHNAGNGWTGSFPSPCFLLSATENPSVGSIPTSGTP